MPSLPSSIPRVLCQVPRAAQAAAKSLEKAELGSAFISVGILGSPGSGDASPRSGLTLD